MTIRTKSTATSNRLFNKHLLASAVAATMFSSTVFAVEPTLVEGASTVTGNLTTSYRIGEHGTLTIGASGKDPATTFNGTIDSASGVEEGSVIITGNVTMSGNIGSTNRTGNITLHSGNTLTLGDNVTIFNTSNITMQANSVINFGNSTVGYNRASTDAITMSANISMGSNSTINIGSNTNIHGNIWGITDGLGTVNILGNFTATGLFGAQNGSIPTGEDAENTLAQVNISAGNTFTLGENYAVNATNMDINGTVTSAGNITASVTIGDGGTLNLDTGLDGDASAGDVIGTIGGNAAGVGTLNINGTWSTQGIIGGLTSGLSAINIDVDNNATSQPSHTVTFAHNVNATNITLGTSTSHKNATLKTSKTADGTNIVITGNIVGGGNYTAAGAIASGTLDIDSNTVITGTTGTSSKYLAGVTVATAKTLTIKSSIYSGNVTLEAAASGANATLALNGTAGTSYDVYSKIDGGNSAAAGLVAVNSGNWTFRSKIGDGNMISNMNIRYGAWANLSKDVSVNNTISVNGTLNISGSMSLTAIDAIGSGKGLQVRGAISSSSPNATLQISDDAVLTLGSKTSTGVNEGDGASFQNATIRIKGTGTSSYSSNSSAAINIGANNQTISLDGVSIDMLGYNSTYKDAQVVNIIGRGSTSGNNGSLTVTGSVNVLDTSAMLSYSENSATFAGVLDNSTSALQVTVNYVAGATLGITGNTLNVYNAAKHAISTDHAIFSELADMTTNAKVDAALATLYPATGGSAAASATISGSSMGTANTRMAYTRHRDFGYGRNAGGETLDEAIWIQVFGANVDQDTVGGVTGYDASGQGLAIGIDGLSADGTARIGFAGSFANTNVDGKDSTTLTKTDIDTTQIMVYANKNYDDGMYVESVASYAFNDNTGSRRIKVGSVDRTASSSYDSGLFAVNVEAGWPSDRDGVTITPTLGLAFAHLTTDTYTETGAGNTNLKVTPTDVNTMEGKVGIKVTGKSVDADGGVGRPEVRFGVSHNFGDESADTTATFTSGGSSFTTTGVKTDTTKVDVGLGYTYTTPEGDTEISVNADGRHSDSYVQYGAGLTVKWKF